MVDHPQTSGPRKRRRLSSICVLLSPEMVCLQEEENGDVSAGSQSYTDNTYSISLSSNNLVGKIFSELSSKYNLPEGSFELTLQSGDGNAIRLKGREGKTLQELNIVPDRNYYVIMTSGANNSNMNMVYLDVTAEDELLLGASASPTTGDTPITNNLLNVLKDPPPMLMSRYDMICSSGSEVEPVEANKYVGLVNQAMTCYLNSLLQALYMTPEFRNALYNWKFDGQNETTSIPYQLQKLFLNLQTSPKSAVETTDLTTSFGWQGSDAWHQHDIQELCRVMFDALEQKFKDTEQANLINDLYEGKMLDYVKCLECGTEKSREDTFLDIPLPVRPFGSSVAYNSVEEALRAFVQPETLDGNNQYFCEKCNKKCDAHKGLKFIKFPYLLTLHLKRFDFDYNTMHRIKLNDKVVFPELLDLNSFIPGCQRQSETGTVQIDTEKETNLVKCDDSCTTDSGSADDESCQGGDALTDCSHVNGQDDNCADSDEGIDVSSGNNHNENNIEVKGPYTYELFSIMIHSGSASGGHYYAYIKDFEKNLWFCFNDQSVTGITEDDIRKTYGGGPHRGYYSGAYSSSTNAYMLMYRQIDKERNCYAMSVDNFPPHIKELLEEMHRREEEERIYREKESERIKLNVTGYHPGKNSFKSTTVSLLAHENLGDAAQYAHQKLKLDGVVPVEDCRLVMYNQKHECIDCSFDSDQLTFADVAAKIDCEVFDLNRSNWLLEIKKSGDQFESYKRGGINRKFYPINLETEDIDEPILVRVNVDETLLELKNHLSSILNIDVPHVLVVMQMSNNEPKFLANDNDVVKFDASLDYKFFVANSSQLPDETVDLVNFKSSKLYRLVDKYSYIINLNVFLPDTDIGTLEMLSIPSLDLNQNLDNSNGANSPNLRVSPQPSGGMCGGDGFGDQSNSEDSSLSDSDRTLVGDATGEYGIDYVLSKSSESPTDQHMASPSDQPEDPQFELSCEHLHPLGSSHYDITAGQPATEDMNWDDDETQQEVDKCSHYFFKVSNMILLNNGGESEGSVRCCRILADKRMTLQYFKKQLEAILRVPMDYFKLHRQYMNGAEWSCLSDTLRSARDGEKVIVKLGRVLQKGEYSFKIYHLKPDCKEITNYLFDHIIARGQTVAAVKKEILLQAKKQFMLDIPFNKCRLREKNWKRPKVIYLNDQVFGDDIAFSNEFSTNELYLQELKDVDKVTSVNQTALFVRHVMPSELKLGDIEEVVLENRTHEELKKKISELSNIPVEFLDIAYVNMSFPCNVNFLDIHSSLDWCSAGSSDTNGTWPLQGPSYVHNIAEGNTFFYKDSREPLRELTTQERKMTFRKSYKQNYYSPGRERPLKIYLDPSPTKSDENSSD